MRVNIIGAGLAGCEAAYQLAKRNIFVKLIEMKPIKKSAAHKSENFSELVCSNSLRSDSLENGVGLLKEEMRRLDSLIMRVADSSRIPAGSALAVDRESFSKNITDIIKNNPHIEIEYREYDKIIDEPTIIATGPLTSDTLYNEISKYIDDDGLYFYDAAAPIVLKDTIDFSKAYYKSRYDKGDGKYINCPMSEEEFNIFYDALVNAETHPIKEFEKEIYFEGCMPVEIMAKRGRQTLLFGPMKPVGLEKDDIRPYAVVQLRQDNFSDSLYNIVGFQTHLTFPEQKRVFSLIPGLENSSFVRYGVMHRNTYLNSPKYLNKHFQLKSNPNIFFAGQITGVEGYVESASSGLLAALNMYSYINDKDFIDYDNTTMIGALANYISNVNNINFQPMNANFGLLKPFDYKVHKKDKKLEYSKRSLAIIEDIWKNI